MKFSVISPVYNVNKYIGNLIKSLDNQKYKNFELILVNDGSTDNSIEIAKKELKKTNIKYKILEKENGGQSSARNYGIKNSSGEWIVIIDSDDTIQSNYLESFNRVIEEKKCDIIICDINRVTDKNIYDETNDKYIIEQDTGKKYFEKFIMHDIEIGPYSLCINRKYLLKEKILYNEKSRYSEEFIFITHLLHDASSVVHLKQRNYNYCLRNGSVSTSANIDKIVNGFNEIVTSSEKYEKCNCESCQVYNKYAHPRWIIATARFSSKNLKYSDYKILLEKLHYKENIARLYDFRKLTIRIVAHLLNKSRLVIYLIFKKVGMY